MGSPCLDAAKNSTPNFSTSSCYPTPPAQQKPVKLAAGGLPSSSCSIAEALKLLKENLAPRRRAVRAGEVLHRAGDRFEALYLLTAGHFKIVSLSSDGREQIVGLKFRGDWLGFDAIDSSEHSSEAVATDAGEVWVLRYKELVVAGIREPMILALLHQAMSRDLIREREWTTRLRTLPADARVAGFLLRWTESLDGQDQQSDSITLTLTRAEIGNYLGVSLESVSRALSRLCAFKLIAFARKGGPRLVITDRTAVSAFVRRSMKSREISE